MRCESLALSASPLFPILPFSVWLDQSVSKCYFAQQKIWHYLLLKKWYDGMMQHLLRLNPPHFDRMTGLELQKRFCNGVKFRVFSSRREICVSRGSNGWDEFDFRSAQSMPKWQRFVKCWHKASPCCGIKGTGLPLTLKGRFKINQTIPMHHMVAYTVKLPVIVEIHKKIWKCDRFVVRDLTYCMMQ